MLHVTCACTCACACTCRGGVLSTVFSSKVVSTWAGGGNQGKTRTAVATSATTGLGRESALALGMTWGSSQSIEEMRHRRYHICATYVPPHCEHHCKTDLTSMHPLPSPSVPLLSSVSHTLRSQLRAPTLPLPACTHPSPVHGVSSQRSACSSTFSASDLFTCWLPDG